ncbi:hypothetical protein Bphy_3895 [Paraburkholderia phymatum STM815]|uniref:Uncharacterized protein n=1 Tax=Paraburkholderia phymatum (strain DSM 17167 / CIP 108236 / LMG 21445 / STM815) TaxID=391038 RepID=B2JNS2_PARP8|nr:hypothetical protein Bphy_3895 [Paraburkholderia phymatum STM815]
MRVSAVILLHVRRAHLQAGTRGIGANPGSGFFRTTVIENGSHSKMQSFSCAGCHAAVGDAEYIRAIAVRGALVFEWVRRCAAPGPRSAPVRPWGASVERVSFV